MTLPELAARLRVAARVLRHGAAAEPQVDVPAREARQVARDAGYLAGLPDGWLEQRTSEELELAARVSDLEVRVRRMEWRALEAGAWSS